MPVLDINNVIEGLKLKKDTLSSLGGLLFKKGTIITNINIEIMKAFGVKQVEVEDDNKIKNIKQTETINLEEKNWNKELIKARDEMSKVLQTAQGSSPISIIEVRNLLSPLIKEIEKNPTIIFTFGVKTYQYKYLELHSLAVGLISYIIAKWNDIPENELIQIGMAGLLHDIGLTRINQKIIEQKGKLTEDEYNEIKKHPVIGYNLIKNLVGISDGVRLAVLQHHERNNGSGYPLGLKSEAIHLYAKIVAVADSFHAMISKRPHRNENIQFVALDKLLNESFAYYERNVVLRFVNGLMNNFLGEKVKLNNNQIGEIIYIDKQNPTKPIIRLIDNNILNLTNEKNIHIVEVL